MAHQWALDRAEHTFERLTPEIRELELAIDEDDGREFAAFHYANVQRIRTLLKKSRLSSTADFDPLRMTLQALLGRLEACEKALSLSRPRAANSRLPRRQRSLTVGIQSDSAAVPLESEKHNLLSLFAAAGRKLSPVELKIVRLMQASLDDAWGPDSEERIKFEHALGKQLVVASNSANPNVV
jgi:hypothetical protein